MLLIGRRQKRVCPPCHVTGDCLLVAATGIRVTRGASAEAIVACAGGNVVHVNAELATSRETSSPVHRAGKKDRNVFTEMNESRNA